MQAIIFLHIGAAEIFCPLALVHASVRPVIYFAVGLLFYKKRIAAKGKMI